MPLQVEQHLHGTLRFLMGLSDFNTGLYMGLYMGLSDFYMGLSHTTSYS